jgi:hypothetical protein
MMEILKWKKVTLRRVEKLLQYHESLFGDEVVNEYKICKCPSALLIMLSDIKKHLIEND